MRAGIVAAAAVVLASLIIVVIRQVPADKPGCGTVTLSAANSDESSTVVRGPAEGGDDRFCGDFPDPFVLPARGRFHAFATNRDGIKVPTLTLGAVDGGGTPEEALPELPGWAEPVPWAVWAPSVLAIDDAYVLYYTLATKELRQCISRATSSSPSGPYTDRSTSPLVCPPAGALDASPLVDPSRSHHLLWKDLGREAIVARRLSSDGLALTGPQRVLLRADQPWEAGVVEGPTMVFVDGTYHLFYSANDWRTDAYAIGHAVCDAPSGPCTKTSSRPWLESRAGILGPGGPEVFADGSGGHSLAFHAWKGDDVGYPDGARVLFIIDVTFDGLTATPD